MLKKCYKTKLLPPKKKQQPGGPGPSFAPKRREVMGLVGVCFLLKGTFLCSKSSSGGAWNRDRGGQWAISVHGDMSHGESYSIGAHFGSLGGGRKGDSTKTPMVRGGIYWCLDWGEARFQLTGDDFFVSFHGIHIFFLGSELMENVWGKLSGISLEWSLGPGVLWFFSPQNMQRTKRGLFQGQIYSPCFSNNHLGGGFKYFLFSPLFGEDSHFWLIFFKWVETTN